MANKVVTLSNLREHATKDSLWVLLKGNGQSCICNSSSRLTVSRFPAVYDVTKFVDEVHRTTHFLLYDSHTTCSTLEAMK